MGCHKATKSSINTTNGIRFLLIPEADQNIFVV